jgi:hypothetical protein
VLPSLGMKPRHIEAPRANQQRNKLDGVELHGANISASSFLASFTDIRPLSETERNCVRSEPLGFSLASNNLPQRRRHAFILDNAVRRVAEERVQDDGQIASSEFPRL